MRKTEQSSENSPAPGAKNEVSADAPSHRSQPPTSRQIASYVAGRPWRDEGSRRMAVAAIDDEGIRRETERKSFEVDPESGMTAEGFLRWMSEGFAEGDVVRFGGEDGGRMVSGIGILTHDGLKSRCDGLKIASYVSDDNFITPEASLRNLAYHRVSEDDERRFWRIATAEGWRYDPVRLALARFHTPREGELVMFEGELPSVGPARGVGVVREVSADGDVTMYCLMVYGPSSKGCIGLGYSMWESEAGGVPLSLSKFTFTPVTDDPGSPLNVKATYRRLDAELEKVGKVWNRRQRRVEPLKMDVGHGERYWWVDDKLKVRCDVENGLRASTERRLAGNYFGCMEEADEARRMMKDACERILARPLPPVARRSHVPSAANAGAVRKAAEEGGRKPGRRGRPKKNPAPDSEGRG